jgi:hypothetical protein
VKCFGALDLDPTVKIRIERELIGEELGFRRAIFGDACRGWTVATF